MVSLSFSVSLLCLGLVLASTPQIQNLDAPGRIDGEYLVVLKETESSVDRAMYIDKCVAELKDILPEIEVIKKFSILKSPILHVKVDSEEIMKQAYQLPNIKLIEANVAQRMAQQCSTETILDSWGLQRISSRPPPDYSSAEYSYHVNGGANVRIYILDTGLNPHNDYEGRAFQGVNTIGGDDRDFLGHGTHCTGISIGTNAGVAKAGTVYMAKVLNDENIGTTASVVEGINWAIAFEAALTGRGVICMPLAGLPSEAIDSAVASALAENMPVVVAAGNDDDDACNYSPARVNGAITVGSTSMGDDLSSFSNWGFCVDILTPGNGILSAHPTCVGCWVIRTGTSVSTSFVAGAVAVFLSENPLATPAEVKTQLTRSASYGYINLRGKDDTPNLVLYERC